MSIQESNKLIAEFMGWKPGEGYYDKYLLLPNDEHNKCFEFVGKKSDALLFHKEWNWLIPVVEKIESLTNTDGGGEVNFIVSIEEKYCAISQGGEAVIIEHQDEEDTKINVVYETILQFIQWYNKPNSQQSNTTP